MTFFGSTAPVRNHALEASVREVVDGGDGLLVPEEALRGEDDERLSPRAEHLAAEAVEQLRRRRQVANLDVVRGRELQEALDAGARVLRTGALVAVGQEEREAGKPEPLVLGGDDELVDDDLRAVGEVAELGLPQDERLRAKSRL